MIRIYSISSCVQASPYLSPSVPQTMEQQIRSGSNSVVHMAWYREHAHPVLLPLDEEEMHLLRSMVGASRQLLHFLQLLQHALDMDDRQEGCDLAAVATNLQGESALLPTMGRTARAFRNFEFTVINCCLKVA